MSSSSSQERMEMRDIKEYIKPGTRLCEYQEETFRWIADRETKPEASPFWKEGEDGRFVNQVSQEKRTSTPKRLRGGILNDEKGLDVKLPLLCWIAMDKVRQSRKGRSVTLPTVVVVPELFKWLDCISDHMSDKFVRYFLGSPYPEEIPDNNDPEDLKVCHVVIMTYDYLLVKGDEDRSFKWRRIILTEVHSPSAQQCLESAAALKGNRRWVITHKPMTVEYLDFILPVLHLEGTVSKDHWTGLLQTLLDRGPLTHSQLMSLVMKITLRRTKVMVGLLPPIDYENHLIDLSSHERNQYNWIKEETHVTSARYNKEQDHTLLPSLETYFTSLREICSDSAICSLNFKQRQFEDVSKKPELKQILDSVTEDSTCPVCQQPVRNASISICGHIFCRTCIRVNLTLDPRCPICRKPRAEADLFEKPPESSKVDSPARGSKVEALCKLLKEHESEDPVGKSVVFSLFPMISLKQTLTDRGFKTLYLYPDMAVKDRKDVIKQFRRFREDRPIVLITSIMPSMKKFNLKGAFRVYLMEVCLKRAENWAIKCVHQVGQKNPVKVVRLIAKDSIEEKVLKLHEKTTRSRESGWGPDQIGLDEINFIFWE